MFQAKVLEPARVGKFENLKGQCGWREMRRDCGVLTAWTKWCST